MAVVIAIEKLLGFDVLVSFGKAITGTHRNQSGATAVLQESLV